MLTQALLVDDSRSVLNFLKRHIEAEGLVEATTFLDPVEALACARDRVFDLVLVDYEMPHMDGISFIRTLRTLPGCTDIPIAMITSRQTDDIKMEALQAGATDFLPKAPQSVEMTVRLRNLIQLGAAVRKLNDRAAHLASEVAAATRKLGEREEEIILRLALAVEFRGSCGSPATAGSSPSSSASPPGSAGTSISPPRCTTSARSPFPTTSCSSPAGSPTTRWR